MNSLDEDEQAVQKIEALNQPVLRDFLTYLKGCHLSPKTIKSHDDNLGFFANYLIVRHLNF